MITVEVRMHGNLRRFLPEDQLRPSHDVHSETERLRLSVFGQHLVLQRNPDALKDALSRVTHQLRVQRARLLQRVFNDELCAVRKLDHATIARLAAALRIEWRAVEHERASRAFAQFMLLGAAGDNRCHRAVTALSHAWDHARWRSARGLEPGVVR